MSILVLLLSVSPYACGFSRSSSLRMVATVPSPVTPTATTTTATTTRPTEQKLSVAARLSRAVSFYSAAVPIFASYKLLDQVTEWRKTVFNEDVSEAEVEAQFQQLHDWGSDKIADKIKELKGFYVKTGQIISTRVDIFPEQYTSKLAATQDALDPLPAETIKEVVRTELLGGADLSELFLEFDDEPLGSASIAQVRRVRWPAWIRCASPVVQARQPRVFPPGAPREAPRRPCRRGQGAPFGPPRRPPSTRCVRSSTPTDPRPLPTRPAQVQRPGIAPKLLGDIANLKNFAKIVGDALPIDYYKVCVCVCVCCVCMCVCVCRGVVCRVGAGVMWHGVVCYGLREGRGRGGRRGCALSRCVPDPHICCLSGPIGPQVFCEIENTLVYELDFLFEAQATAKVRHTSTPWGDAPSGHLGPRLLSTHVHTPLFPQKTLAVFNFPSKATAKSTVVVNLPIRWQKFPTESPSLSKNSSNH